MSEEILEGNISRENMYIEKSYAFLSRAEENGLPFTLEDICKASGYAKGTADGYYQKKWYWFVRKDGEHYYCEGLHRCPFWYYDLMLRQKEMPLEDFINFVCRHTGLRPASLEEPLDLSPKIEREHRRDSLLEWLLLPAAIIWWLWHQITEKPQDATRVTNDEDTLKDGAA